MSRYAGFVFLFLAACGNPAPAPDESPKPEAVAAVAPPANAITDYSLQLAFGHRMDLSGNVEDQESFTWYDVSGKEHSVGAPAELKPLAEGMCVYMLAGSDGMPVVPLKIVQVDFLEYCMVGDGPNTMTGLVKEERDIRLIEDGKPVTVKTIVLMLQPKPDPAP